MTAGAGPPASPVHGSRQPENVAHRDAEVAGERRVRILALEPQHLAEAADVDPVEADAAPLSGNMPRAPRGRGSPRCRKLAERPEADRPLGDDTVARPRSPRARVHDVKAALRRRPLYGSLAPSYVLADPLSKEHGPAWDGRSPAGPLRDGSCRARRCLPTGAGASGCAAPQPAMASFAHTVDTSVGTPAGPDASRPPGQAPVGTGGRPMDRVAGMPGGRPAASTTQSRPLPSRAVACSGVLG